VFEREFVDAVSQFRVESILVAHEERGAGRE
jgi:hypothetical protein